MGGTKCGRRRRPITAACRNASQRTKEPTHKRRCGKLHPVSGNLKNDNPIPDSNTDTDFDYLDDNQKKMESSILDNWKFACFSYCRLVFTTPGSF
jgi:hypothetical protein